MTLRKAFLLLLSLISINVLSAVHINSLDAAHPIVVERYAATSMCYIIYEGKEIYLSEHCIYLDSELSDNQVASFPFIYNNVREALNALNERGTTPDLKTLYIAPGVYWVDDPDDPAIRKEEKQRVPYGMTVNCNRLQIIGMNDNPENIVLACNRGNMRGAINNFTMLNMNCDEIEAKNVTFGNYCNVDLNFPLKPEYSREKRNEAITQAQLIHTTADKVFAQNCRFISRLNLSPFAGGHRILFDHCYMECTDDALAGSAVYHKCKFTFYTSKPLYDAQPYGAVFLDCDIDTHVKGVQYFCKAAGGIVAIDVRFHAVYPEKFQGVSFNYQPKVDSWYFSNVTVDGESLDYLEESAMDITGLPIEHAYKLEIDGKTVYNVANLVGGDDEWDPLEQRGIIPEEYIYIPTYMQVQNMGEGILLSPYDDGSELVFNFFRWGGYEATHDEIVKVASTEVNWDKPKFLQVTTCQPRKSVNITTHYDLPTRYSGNITAVVFSGLYAINYITIAPYLYEAPRFQEKPKIMLNKQRYALNMNYQLTPDDSGASDAGDRSIITWYRYSQTNLSDTVPMLWGYTNEAIKTYPLAPGDIGYKFLVDVNPRYSDTFSGMPAQARYTQEFDQKELPELFLEEKHYETDFHNIPVRYQPQHLKSAWTFDAHKPMDTKDFGWDFDKENAWYFGRGVGSAKDPGLVHNSRGARCFYIPAREKSKNMKALVQVDLAKAAGQGFGGPSAQYLDICIKFDPESLTGYAIRIERIPDYSNACSFCLVKYENGETKYISQPVISNCFVSTCTITVEMKGKKLTATASSTAELKKTDDPNIKSDVYLSAKVEKNPYSAFCLQHTGTAGTSAAVFRYLELDWK